MCEIYQGQSTLEFLSEYITIRQCKNNKKIYISNECPFCDKKNNNEGGRSFRYNSKLKVGKFYCCGVSFKEKYWFLKQLDKDFLDNFLLDN